jgi:uncharacterized protein
MLCTSECAGPTFRIVDEVHITPVNYGVDQPLLFRTAEGTKLLGHMGTQLAFEVDEVPGGFARSVFARGPHVGCRMTRLSRPN